MDDAPAAGDTAFRMPAEWESHRATWLVWPHNRDDWPGKFETIPWAYVEIVRALAPGEAVAVLVAGEEAEREARERLALAAVDLAQVEFYRIPTDRSWIRDSGPTFVEAPCHGGRTELVMIDWRFNAWAKYDNWHLDNQVPARMASGRGVRCVEAVAAAPAEEERQVVMEGGAIETNGQGLLLATEECLLSDVQARNPGLPRDALEAAFAQYLGTPKVLWLAAGIAGDDTHGHIDDIARFVDPRTVVAALEEDPADANYEPLRENRARLAAATDTAGRTLRVLELPMPRALPFDGLRLPASYLNFYIGNRVVLVPTFNDPNDRHALARLAELFPGREVVGIHAVELILGFGSIHCLTQQEPALRTSRSD